jgi:hypothetical protein
VGSWLNQRSRVSTRPLLGGESTESRYAIDDSTHTVQAWDISHRRDTYHRSRGLRPVPPGGQRMPDTRVHSLSPATIIRSAKMILMSSVHNLGVRALSTARRVAAVSDVAVSNRLSNNSQLSRRFWCLMRVTGSAQGRLRPGGRRWVSTLGARTFDGSPVERSCPWPVVWERDS